MLNPSDIQHNAAAGLASILGSFRLGSRKEAAVRSEPDGATTNGNRYQEEPAVSENWDEIGDREGQFWVRLGNPGQIHLEDSFAANSRPPISL